MRFRSPENVVEELKLARSRYASRKFDIVDDNFTKDTKRAKKFCELLIDEGLDMVWSCSNGIRSDAIDEELGSLMSESGCRSVGMGIETFDTDIFENIGKGEKIEEIEGAIQILRSCGIAVEGFFLIGLPGGNLQKIRSSLERSKQLKIDKVSWSYLVPYPGTGIREWVLSKARMLRPYWECNHFGPKAGPAFETDNFTETEMIYAYIWANIKGKAYYTLIDLDRSLLCNIFRIITLVFRYDLRNLHSHIWYVLKNFGMIWWVNKRRY